MYAKGDPSAWDFPLARGSHGELAVGPSNTTFFEFSWQLGMENNLRSGVLPLFFV